MLLKMRKRFTHQHAGVAKIVTEDEDELSLCQDGDDTEIAVTDETRLQSGMAISHGNKYFNNYASCAVECY